MDAKKAPHWKGQSRVLSVCHWCAKQQQPHQKPFQACARCKEVIYCSKECQVASWPLHKGPCKLSADAKLATAAIPGAATAVANFKKWHSSHLGPLRHAAICALDLGHNPGALDDHIVFIEVSLKPDHRNLSPNRRYRPVGGFTMTLDETREMLAGHVGSASILDSFKDANEHMRKKGGIGVAALMLKAHDMVDIVKIVLPTAAVTKKVQEDDDWGQLWLEKLCVAVEID